MFWKKVYGLAKVMSQIKVQSHKSVFLQISPVYLTFLRVFIPSICLITFSKPGSPPTETEIPLQAMITLTFKRLLIIILHLNYNSLNHNGHSVAMLIYVNLWSVFKLTREITVNNWECTNNCSIKSFKPQRSYCYCFKMLTNALKAGRSNIKTRKH